MINTPGLNTKAPSPNHLGASSQNFSGRLWTALDGSGRLWTEPHQQAKIFSGRLWTALDGSGRLWTALDTVGA